MSLKIAIFCYSYIFNTKLFKKLIWICTNSCVNRRLDNTSTSSNWIWLISILDHPYSLTVITLKYHTNYIFSIGWKVLFLHYFVIFYLIFYIWYAWGHGCMIYLIWHKLCLLVRIKQQEMVQYHFKRNVKRNNTESECIVLWKYLLQTLSVFRSQWSMFDVIWSIQSSDRTRWPHQNTKRQKMLSKFLCLE